MSLDRVTKVLLLQDHTHKGFSLLAGTEIELKIRQAERLEARGICRGIGEVYIVDRGEQTEKGELEQAIPGLEVVMDEDEDDTDSPDGDSSE